MLNLTHLKADIRQIGRDPIMVILFFVPFFIFIVFRLLTLLLIPWIAKKTGFDFTLYNGYLASVAVIVTPQLMGTVTGFLMIDERDENIVTLMSVIPTGYKGYIINRMTMLFATCVAYTFISFFILKAFVNVGLLKLILLSLLAGVEGIIIGLLLLMIAKDKVQGLTCSKGMGVFAFFALADILNIDWAVFISSLTPFYWISKIVRQPIDISLGITAFIVHVVWAGLVLTIFIFKENR